MRQTFLVEKAGNNLAIASLISGILAILTALLLHFFSYLFPGFLNTTTLNIFISIPVVIGIFSLISGIISLRKIMDRNIFGKGKAIIGIVFGSVVVVCLIIFLFYLFS